MKTLASLAFLAVCASQIGATDCGQIISDSGFDLWCGDRLCKWDLERGQIAPVPSWHTGDDAVEMVGDDVAFSQRTAVNSTDTDCIRFDLIGDIEETAEVHLQADVFGDGTIDFDQRLPTSSWDAVSLRIGVSGYYDGILFRLTKVGPGKAVLAQISAEVVEDGDGGCPSYLDPVPLPLGASCGFGQSCGDGVCNDGVCGECLADTDCADGEVCGQAFHVPGLLDAHTACVAEGSRAVGEPCDGADECASGACGGQVCGECQDASLCDGGATCRDVSEAVPLAVCTNDARASGEGCATNDACASGVCEGAPMGWCDSAGGLLYTLGPCYADTECPVYPEIGVGTCTFVAVAGGTCQ